MGSADFQLLFESAPGAYLVLLPDAPRYTIAAVSDEYLRGTRTARDEILGKSLFEAFPSFPADGRAIGMENLRASLDRLRASLRTDAIGLQQYDIETPDDSGYEMRWWRPINYPVVDASGELRYIIHHIEDVTEFVRTRAAGDEREREAAALRDEAVRLEAEILLRSQQLEAANRELTRVVRVRESILGIVAHDLGNPINSIQLSLSVLQRRLMRDGVRADLEPVLRSCSRAHRLIRDLLDFTRLEEGKLSFVKERVVPTDVLRDVVSTQQALAGVASIELACAEAAGLPEVWADRERLVQAFENLVGNAIKFTASGGRITLGATREGSEVRFWVSDTGSGIPAEDVPRVFERFWQGTEKADLGTGLGLAIVKGIVETGGGRLGIESEPGTGSTFSFTMPVAGARPA